MTFEPVDAWLDMSVAHPAARSAAAPMPLAKSARLPICRSDFIVLSPFG
jgi:hypothetical protein